MVIDIAPGKGRPICDVQSVKLSSEIGVISCQFISVPTNWKALTDDEKLHAFERLNTKFEMKMDDDYVKSSVLSMLMKLSRNHRYKLHKHFKKFSSPEKAH
ncbi:hypothetical protein REPUB_Repub02eG0116900 [Reevesia pubescens]